MRTQVIVTWTQVDSSHCFDDFQLDMAENKLLRYQINSMLSVFTFQVFLPVSERMLGTALSSWLDDYPVNQPPRYMMFFQHIHTLETHSMIRSCRPLLCPESPLSDSSISYVKENSELLNVRPAHQRILTARLDLRFDLSARKNDLGLALDLDQMT